MDLCSVFLMLKMLQAYAVFSFAEFFLAVRYLIYTFLSFCRFCNNQYRISTVFSAQVEL
jgi:hypothetical protein